MSGAEWSRAVQGLRWVLPASNPLEQKDDDRLRGAVATKLQVLPQVLLERERFLSLLGKAAPLVHGRESGYTKRMHFPYFMRRVNRVFTNPLMRSIAWVVPPLAIVHHVGRKSGRPYRTPVVAFRTEKGFVIPLTYGRDVDWAQNLIKARRGLVEQLGRKHELVNPRIVGRDEAYRLLPPVVRSVLYAADLPGFVVLEFPRHR
ncbi:MAG: nitroreductase family deazaflavin-dependent oxidoreductase [Candidatus Binatia bacterium]|nr:nitroreductase family deazaflavin-dependent oxidoreductase [Candidatus Binatia bacterium]